MRYVHVSTDFYSYNKTETGKKLPFLEFPIHARKPENIGYVSNRLAMPENRFYMPFKNLMEAVSRHGMTFSPGIFENNNRSQQGFIGSEMVALDFDNGLEMQEALDIANFYGVTPNCIYETFSSTPKLRKFRMIWILDHFVTNAKIYRFLMSALQCIFDSKADRQALEVSRLFYGSNKGVWYFNEAPVLSVPMVTTAVMAKIENSYGKNLFKKKQEEFFVSQGILWEDNRPKIGITENDRENGVETHIYYICNSTRNSLCYKMEIETPDDTNIPYVVKIPKSDELLSVEFCHTHRGAETKYSNAENYKINREDFEKCALIKLGLKGQLNEPPLWLYDPALWNMVRNLALFKGGEKIFKDIMNANPIYWEETIVQEDGKRKTYKKAQHYIKRFKDIRKTNDVKPSKCSNEVCPLYNKCLHRGTIISKIKPMKHRPIIEERPLLSREEGERLLKHYFNEAVTEDALTLLIAPTAIGKTEAVINYLEQNPHKSLLIAEKTHDMAEQLEQRLSKRGIIPLRVLPLPKPEEIEQFTELVTKERYTEFYNEVQRLRSNGFYGEVFLKEQEMYFFMGKVSTKYWDYWYNKKQAKKWKGNLIMTHDQLAHWDSIKQDAIVIDECPSNTLYKQLQVPISELNYFIGLNPPQEVKDHLRGILEAPYNEAIKTTPPNIDLTEFLKANKKYIQSNYWDILKSEAFIKDRQNVTFKVKNKLERRGKPMIIMTATPKITALKASYPDMKIKRVSELETVGRVLNYWSNSCSKAFFDTEKRSGKDFKEFLTGVVLPETGMDVNIITHKKYHDLYKKEFPQLQGYFFNTEGYDHLKGKDLVIIGTPWRDLNSYKLDACIFNMNVTDFSTKWQECELECRKFWFNAFNDLQLRELQFQSIENELLQAIGRGRHLRYNITVYYYGNFPLPETIVID